MFKNNYIWKLIDAFVSYLIPFLHYLVTLLLVLLGLYLIYLIFRLVFQVKSFKNQSVFLEITPPNLTEQSSFTTVQLFNAVHGLLRQKGWLNRLFDISKQYSFEIYSTKEKGIRYVFRISSDDAQNIRKSLVSYLPGVKIKEIGDYLGESSQGIITTVKLSNNFLIPLKKQENLKEYDPIAYLTGAMTKLNDEDLVSVQFIVSPIDKYLMTIVKKCRGLFINNGDVFSGINVSSSILVKILALVLQIILIPIGIMVFLFTEGREGPILPINVNRKFNKTSPYKEAVAAQIKNKIDQQLFSCSLRIFIKTSSKDESLKIKKGFMSALSPFTNSSHQSLVSKRFLKINIIKNINLWLFKNRININRDLVLSTSELSDLYHFPYMTTTKTENISKLHTKELPAPISLKNKEGRDIYFAKNVYDGTETMIGLTKDERRRHVYIIGATGTGKSTMILSMIKQDIDNNKGVCLLDPHGDLTEQILGIIPKERIKDVVYFNPDDIAFPMGINLLELTPNLNVDDALREKEFIAESIISVFNKIYSDKYSGPRMEYILRNAIYTVFTVPNATLFTVNKLLINTAFRKSVVSKLTDENLIEFWKYEFGKSGDFQKVSMVMPITNKIGRFLFSPTAKRILGQEKSTINFDSIMNGEKILLCNLSKGKIGEDNSSVFGVLILAKIQLAALKRSRIKPEERKDFYLYVDEFQNFATPAFAQILSEARKYKLCATLAHQTTSQIEESSLTNIILANTGTVICFRTANPEDEKMILPQFKPYVIEGEISNLPSYHFFMKLGALNPEEPFSGVTIPIKIKDDERVTEQIINSSRRLYAMEWKEEVKENYLETIERMRGKKTNSKGFTPEEFND